MPRRPDASSIYELLTSPNPTVYHSIPKNRSNSNNHDWYYPKQIKEWEEFKTFDILTQSIVGNLLQEAHRQRQLSFPLLREESDCNLQVEKSTEKLITKWNESIVLEALIPVQHTYNPLTWVKGRNPKSKRVITRPPDPQERRAQPRKCNQNKKPKQRSIRGIPDSGSTAYSELPTDGRPVPDAGDERFPKEYKPATKWKSSWIDKHNLVDESGKWLRGRTTRNKSLPVMQAYTYCVLNMCRYGAILTCEEAFLFRIKPLDPEPPDTPDDDLLEFQLVDNGLMEYISIPWTNHNWGSSGQPQQWTVNLALWFMHILAGNNFRVGWGFGREDQPRPNESSEAEHSEQAATVIPQDAEKSTPSTTSKEKTPSNKTLPDEDTEEYAVAEDDYSTPVSSLVASDNGEDGEQTTQPATPEAEALISPLDSSPLQKRKREADEPSWSFSSKRSSRR